MMTTIEMETPVMELGGWVHYVGLHNFYAQLRSSVPSEPLLVEQRACVLCTKLEPLLVEHFSINVQRIRFSVLTESL
jgi:hypothetical protein